MANDYDGISMDPQRAPGRRAQDRGGARPTTASRREDVIIDPLTMPIGAAPDAATSMFETMRLIRDELGVNVSCGASNISFGMPDRRGIDATFLTMSIVARHEHRDHEPAARAGRARRSSPPTCCSVATSTARRGSRGTARELAAARSGGVMAGGKVEVTYLPSEKTVRVPEGTTLFNAAHWAGLPIESTCGGRGTCGKCGVKVLEGEAELLARRLPPPAGPARRGLAPLVPVPDQRAR